MIALLKLALMLCWLIVMMVPIALIMLCRLEGLRRDLAWFTFKVMALILGIRVTLEGKQTDKRPLLMVSNHCSYIDIVVLGTAMPISFTPKSDIKWWPLIGWCCVLAGCVFVERKASKLTSTRKEIHRKLQMGRAVCLFAEGTTNDGNKLKPFKSGFFSLAEGEDELFVQPMTISYVARNGKALDAEGRSQIAWFGEDTTLMPHFIRLMSARSITAKVTLHPPVTMSEFDSRKALCKHCEDVISERFYAQIQQ